MLSDDKMWITIPQDKATIDEHGEMVIVPGETQLPIIGAAKVRDFYEDLITSGKLRVVEEEEVEFASNDYDCLLACTGCNWKIGWHIMEDIEPMKFCPGCRRKIKQNE